MKGKFYRTLQTVLSIDCKQFDGCRPYRLRIDADAYIVSLNINYKGYCTRPNPSKPSFL